MTLLLLSPTSAQDAPKTVTYSTVAAPVARVVEEIGKAVGEPLAVSQANRDAVLAVHLQDAPLPDVLSRIAKATSSVWRREPDGRYLLAKDAAAQAAETRLEQAARAEDLRKALAKMMEPASPPGAQGGQQQPTVVPAMGPAAKAIVELARQLDLNVLASIPPDGRVVFATRPTRMQRPLGSNAGTVLSRMIQEQNAEAVRRQGETVDEATQKLLDFAESLGVGGSRSQISGSPVKALLVATRMPFVGALNLQLKLYDREGAVVFRSTQMVNQQSLDFLSMFGGGSGAPATQGDASEGPDADIEFSSHTQAMRQQAGGLMTGGGMPKFPPEVEERLARPDVYDPLSYAESEALLAVAKHKKLNLIANLPDSLISPLAMLMPSGKVTVNGHLRNLKSNKEVVLDQADGWLVVSPAKPAEARSKRANRPALAKLIAAVRSKPIASLDDYASYAAVAEPPMETPAAMMSLMVFAPNSMSAGITGMLNWDMLRLHGNLGAAQRRQLESGGRLALGSLTPQQRLLAEKLVFGASARLTGGGEPAVSEAGFMEMVVEMVGAAASKDYRDEPTELMPNGLPPAGWIDLNLVQGSFAMAAGADGKPERRFGAMGTEELAMIRYLAEDPNFAQFGGLMPKIDTMFIGERKTLRYLIHVAEGVVVRHVLHDDKIQPGASAMALGQAPAAFRDAVQRRLEALKKNPIPFNPAMMGGGRTPPP